MTDTAAVSEISAVTCQAFVHVNPQTLCPLVAHQIVLRITPGNIKQPFQMGGSFCIAKAAFSHDCRLRRLRVPLLGGGIAGKLSTTGSCQTTERYMSGYQTSEFRTNWHLSKSSATVSQLKPTSPKHAM